MPFDLANYREVQDRINEFWDKYPNGAITTEVVFSPDYDHVIIKASVYKGRPVEGNGYPDATGIAGEERGKGGMANTTNWHENCETSAIGRALANLGRDFAKNAQDRPSREEMAKAQRLSQQDRPMTAPEVYGVPDPEPPPRTAEEIHDRVASSQGYDALVMAMPPPEGISDKRWNYFRDLAQKSGHSFKNIEGQMRLGLGLPQDWTVARMTWKEISPAIDWLRAGGRGVPAPAEGGGGGYSPKAAAAANKLLDRHLDAIGAARTEAALQAAGDAAVEDGLYGDHETAKIIEAALKRQLEYIDKLHAPV